MRHNESQKPFSSLLKEVGLVLALPTEAIVNEALRLKSLSDYDQASLNETINARPEINVDSVKDLIKSFQSKYEELKKILDDLTNGQISSLASIHEENLTKAQELFEELKIIKGQIEEVLLQEANLDPATGPVEEPGVLPTGYAIPRVYYDIETETQKPLTPEEEVSLKLFELYQSGSKDTWSTEGRFKPINVVKDEIRKVLSLGGYSSGQINAIFVREINPISGEIGKLDKLQGREKKEKLIEIYERVVKVAQDKIFNTNHRFRRASKSSTLNLNNVPTLPEEDIVFDPKVDIGEFKGVGNNISIHDLPTLNETIDNLYINNIEKTDYQFAVMQANFKYVVRPVLSEIGLGSSQDLEEAEKLISEYQKIETNNTAQSFVAKSDHLLRFKELLEKVRLIKIKGDKDGEYHFARILEADGNQVLVERISSPGSNVTTEWITLAELKELNSPVGFAVDAPADLPPIDKTVPLVNESSDNTPTPVPADVTPDHNPVPPVVDTPATAPVEVTPATNINPVVAPEASAVEAEQTAEEVYNKEEKRYSELIKKVNENQFLALKFYWIPDRVKNITGAVDYIKSIDSGYESTVKEEKIRQNYEILAKLNNLMAEDLSVGLDPVPPTPEPAPVPEPVTPPVPDEPIPSPIPPTPTTKPAPVPPLPVGGVDIPNPAPGEPLMDAHVDAFQKDKLLDAHVDEFERANRLKTAGLTAPRQFDTVPFKEREKMRGEYNRERTIAMQARRDFIKAETEFETKRNEFYRNQSLFSKAGGAIRTLFGGQPKFPPELQKLQIIYEHTKKNYAPLLRDAWAKRAGAFAGNKVLDEAKPNIKKAFAERFILNQRQRLLSVQQEAYDKATQNSKLFKSTMNFVRKHKTPLRWLGFGVAAGGGALIGGLPLASLRGVRWGMATFGGAATAEFVYKRKQKGINDAVSSVNLEQDRIVNEFTVEKLSELDESLAFTDLALKRAKLEQKVYSVGAAVLVGGVATGGAALVENFSSPEVSTGARVSGKVTGENNVVDGEARVRELSERVRIGIAEDNARLKAERMGVGSQPAESLVSTPDSPVSSNEAPLNLKVTPETILQMRGVKVPHYAPSGELTLETSVSNILIQGQNGSALPKEVASEIYPRLYHKVNDILGPHPNFSKVALEKIMFNELQNTYGGQDWWKTANISEVKIDSLITNRPGVSGTIPGVGVRADVNLPESATNGEVVAKEATLVADNPTTPSEAMPMTEPSYPSSSDEQPIIYARRGGLPVDQADNGVRPVPIINAVYKPVEVFSVDTITEIESPRVINHPALEQVEPVPVPPSPDSYFVNGKYTTEFQNYLISEYGSVAKFNKILLNQALTVEGNTYSGINSWLNEYESPYQKVLAKVTIGDLNEAFGGPEAGSTNVVVDSTGLPTQYKTDVIRQYAADNNFKYETVREWLVRLEDLKREFPHQNTTTLEELFTMSLIEADKVSFNARGIRT